MSIFSKHKWQPIDTLSPVYSHCPILLFGVLEGETSPDVHEGFHNGKHHCSVRDHEMLERKKRITATHWMPMPPAPPCPLCNGKGIIPRGYFHTQPCTDCHGSGHFTK